MCRAAAELGLEHISRVDADQGPDVQVYLQLWISEHA
jgi:hypothetical protein